MALSTFNSMFSCITNLLGSKSWILVFCSNENWRTTICRSKFNCSWLFSTTTTSHRTLPSPSDFALLTTWSRKDADVRLLVGNVPEPPSGCGYSFTPYQRQQQANFFKWVQDRNVPMYNIDLYNADIIAIRMFIFRRYILILILVIFVLHFPSAW